jgi:hypothetical protein
MLKKASLSQLHGADSPFDYLVVANRFTEHEGSSPSSQLTVTAPLESSPHSRILIFIVHLHIILQSISNLMVPSRQPSCTHSSYLQCVLYIQHTNVILLI